MSVFVREKNEQIKFDFGWGSALTTALFRW